MADGKNVYLWHQDGENDFRNLLRYLQKWIIKHQTQNTFGDSGRDLAIDVDMLADAVADIHRHLGILGDRANCCKRAATVIANLCRHCPLVLKRAEEKVSVGDKRMLLLVNVKAAYEVAEAITRQASHDQYLDQRWNFKNRAQFPSIHSYLEFILSLSKLYQKSIVADHAISRIALIMELNLYRTNPQIAGIADPSLMENIHSKTPAFLEYGMLNLDRNADHKIDIPKT
jgi:hypothetical protein